MQNKTDYKLYLLGEKYGLTIAIGTEDASLIILELLSIIETSDPNINLKYAHKIPLIPVPIIAIFLFLIGNY